MTELPLLQPWLSQPEPGFRPGRARFRQEGRVLVMESFLEGGPPHSSASAHGQRLWEHGDVAELFLQKVGESSYREYQVSPNGFTLALRYPDATGVSSVRSGDRAMEDFLSDEIPDIGISVTSVGWSVTLTVPLPSASGERFRVSCCRYDHSPGGPAVISTTSPHPVRDFHRPEDWRILDPVAG